ncbi:hypothetical protein ASF61_06865 [Duganella sp. Leaf126]|uniref:hypothetical protein n=1 Tax=Duganella sp. Leaf126 TaxID=1736266 RepID=UPI0007019E9C|nr:hypothetical protein [Duganella sp. Leaf126]KQQ40468.1 hypothetical protein ASF61_06865 [Duganella sp. Leaf126]
MNTINNAVKLATAGFDVALLASPEKIAKTHTVEVAHDDDGNMLAGFDIVGKNSVQYRDVVRATSVTAIKRSQTKKEQIDAKTDAGAGAVYDLSESRNRKIAIAVVVGAPGFVSNGQPVELTEGFLNLCFDAQPTWQDKILTALEADANFLAI